MRVTGGGTNTWFVPPHRELGGTCPPVPTPMIIVGNFVVTVLVTYVK